MYLAHSSAKGSPSVLSPPRATPFCYHNCDVSEKKERKNSSKHFSSVSNSPPKGIFKIIIVCTLTHLPFADSPLVSEVM